MNGVSVFRYGLLIVLMVIGVTAMAEPDPEGSPARGLQVERTNRLLKFAQPSTPAEQREKMTASPDEQ